MTPGSSPCNAFGTPEIESRLHEQGVTSVLDKPFDFPRLRKAVTDALSAMAQEFPFANNYALVSGESRRILAHAVPVPASPAGPGR